ncbi:MAG: hypothetical protein E6J23_10315 [Chloroflexi bacterium]|nr:MAG: hypothetical protein E6J23_10315 [Chloroflexota bacterium]
MIWLTLREHRAQLAVMALTATLLALGLFVMGNYAAAERIALGVDTCIPLPNTNSNCVDLSVEWMRRIGPAPYLVGALLLVPALAASFVGGPLFGGELERGTHRLALTQAVSRVRWGATKIGLALAIALACAVVLAQLGWSARVLNGLPGGIKTPFDGFEVDGPPMVGYWLFGIGVGGLIGAWSRRALTGMFVGLLLFVGARALVGFELRPYYEPPLVAYDRTDWFARQAPSYPSGAWVLHTQDVDAQDRPVDSREMDRLMQRFGPSAMAGGPTNPADYLATVGVRKRIIYQPAERYAKFQWIELGIFTSLAAGCALLTIVLMRRRDA